MANDISPYNPIFYAQEALILLENALGMAARVHRGYDAERRSVEAGDTIQIRKPGTFTAQNAPGSAQDLAPEKMDLVVNQHKEVRISLTDKDLALSEDRIIADHIRPAAYALANDVDLALNGLYADIPWLNDAAGSANIVDLTGPYQTLFDIGVPMDPEFLHLEVNGTQQAYFQQLDIFHDASKRGTAGETETLRRGSLGHALGFEVFANQNVQSHTKGTASTGVLLVNGTFLVGVKSIDLDTGTVTGTLVPGDTFVIAGDTQRYSVTALNTASGNAFTGVAFTPALKAAPADNASVTVSLDDHAANLGFHRNAFAFATAPLPMVLQNQLGAQVETITDPDTGLSLRARLFYDGDNTFVVLDILYGVKTLDENLATRLRGSSTPDGVI